MVSLQQIINSSLGLRLVSMVAQRLSPWTGYYIAYFLAEQIARQRNSRLVEAVRANQWVITGEVLRGQALDWIVRQTFRQWARSIFDLYHYIGNSDAAKQLIVLEPSFRELVQRPEFERRGKRRGLVIAGLHLSNFDLILQWLCKQGMKTLVLSIPDPRGGRQVEYEIRKRTGMNLVPTSVNALRHAIRYLQQGGVVVTGIDRPIPHPAVCPRFFGHPAALPMHHIFLAQKTHVPLILAVASLQKDERYHVWASDPIEMDSHSDSSVAILHNAEKVLAKAEEFIRQYPQQWSVPLPVWPQIMNLVPK